LDFHSPHLIFIKNKIKVMTYQIKLKDLRKQDGLYYIADIVDIDGSGWVDKDMALQTIDMLNAEANQPIIDDFEDDFFINEEF